MPHPPKRKGNRFERELVATLQAAGIKAERAWGSDGRAIGEASDVDVVATLRGGRRLTVQAKRRRSVASYLPCADADVTVVRADRAEALAVVPLTLLIDLQVEG